MADDSAKHVAEGPDVTYLREMVAQINPLQNKSIDDVSQAYLAKIGSRQ